MEKLTPVRKIICYECKGNGFLHKDFFEVNDAPIVFDGIYEAMLPCRSDCILGSHQESAARLAMGTINTMCYSQSERFNWILWDMSNFFCIIMCVRSSLMMK